MKIIFGLKKLKKFKKPVVVLGVFDGVHLAHRRILREVISKAKKIRGTSVVATFWPHPQRQESLCSLEHRLRLISELGMDVCIVIKFDQAFSRISAYNFIKDILVKKIACQYIYIGKNFRFGRGAGGNFRILEKLSHIYNFKLKVFDVIRIDSQSISSTYIRKLITEGKLNTAKRLLSRPVSVLGTVIKGASLARNLGFPTANIDPHHEVLPPSGVYIVKIIFYDRKLRGICYIGTKPTFKNQKPKIKNQKSKHIEAYIFNFNKNIYGKYLELQFIKKLREEKKFASCLSLAQQIKNDVYLAKRYFSRHQ